MSTLDGSIVNVALPAVMEDLGVHMHTIEWVVVVYLLSVSSLLLPLGRLSDIEGRRWVYCRGFIIFAAGSAFCGLAPGAYYLVAFRAFQGVGAAMLMACSPALVVDTFPPSERGKALGMIGTVVASGLTTGPALGGLLIKTFSWRAIFYVNIPIGIVAAVLAHFILRGGPGDVARKETFDWRGAILMCVSMVSFFLAVVKALDWGLTSGTTLGLVGISALTGLWLAILELRVKHPVFDPSLLKIRLFSLPVVSSAILFAGLFTIVFLMPFYLVNPLGLPIDKAGYTMVIPFVCLFFISPFSGALSDRIGSRWLCTAGMTVLATALFFMSELPASADYWQIAWRLALAGTGVAMFLPPNSSIAMSALPPERRGIASGTVATARNVGMVVGVSQAGLIFNMIYRAESGGANLKAYSPDLEPFFMSGFKGAMLAGTILAVLGIAVAFFRGDDKKATAKAMMGPA